MAWMIEMCAAWIGWVPSEGTPMALSRAIWPLASVEGMTCRRARVCLARCRVMPAHRASARSSSASSRPRPRQIGSPARPSRRRWARTTRPASRGGQASAPGVQRAASRNSPPPPRTDSPPATAPAPVRTRCREEVFARQGVALARSATCWSASARAARARISCAPSTPHPRAC